MDNITSFKLKIRRLRRRCNIPPTYIFNYDPGSTAGLNLSMLPSIKSENYVSAINIGHQNREVKVGDILREVIIAGEILGLG